MEIPIKDGTSPSSAYFLLLEKNGYHDRCVDRWLKENGVCPVCKTPFRIRCNYEGERERERDLF
jgi:hypothetical protein